MFVKQPRRAADGEEGRHARTEDEPLQLLDKLGERWLFEKKTVFLYDKIIRKLESLGFDGDLSQLQTFRKQELEHQRKLERYIEQCGSKREAQDLLAAHGGDRVAGVQQHRRGEPRGLAVPGRAARRRDDRHASWDLLIQLARRAGQKDFVQAFQEASDDEKVHLRTVRNMIIRLAKHELVDTARQQPQAT
jgi:hypothetical protein